MTELAVREELLVNLPDQKQATLRDYRDLLFRWNQRFNLTAIRDPSEIDGRLIADGLRLLPAIDVVLKQYPNRVRMIDLGTGAGLPGLVIKITRRISTSRWLTQRARRFSSSSTSSPNLNWITHVRSMVEPRTSDK